MQGAWPVTDFLPRAVAGRGWPRRGRLWRSRGRVVLGVRRFERGGCRVESRCRPRPYVLKLTGEVPELLFGPVLELHEPGAGAFDGTKQLVELEIDRFAVTVLGVLDDEHHQEGDDRGARIDDELPRIGEAVFRPERRPHDDGQHCGQKRPRRPEIVSGRPSKPPEGLSHTAIPLQAGRQDVGWWGGEDLALTYYLRFGGASRLGSARFSRAGRPRDVPAGASVVTTPTASRSPWASFRSFVLVPRTGVPAAM